MRVLRGGDVERACPMPEAIEAVRRGFAALSKGDATVPVRARVPLAGGGVALTMPAALAGGAHFSVKVVSVVPGNPERGLPLVTASVLLGDARTGVPLALIDGSALTALRTGAAGGVAAAALARPESRVAAVFGGGAQARTQILALTSVLPAVREFRVLAGRHAERVAAFAQWSKTRDELRRLDVVAVVATPDAAAQLVPGADVVITATSSSTPVFAGRLLGDGVHITAVGSFLPSMRELDDDAMRGATVVVDQRDAALAEAGELQGLRREDVVEIGEVLAGRARGRSGDEARTIFKSVGNAVQDLVVAARAYERAVELGLGEEIRWP